MYIFGIFMTIDLGGKMMQMVLFLIWLRADCVIDYDVNYMINANIYCVLPLIYYFIIISECLQSTWYTVYYSLIKPKMMDDSGTESYQIPIS